MTLSFQTKYPEHMGELAGQPNYFVEKILKSLPDNHINYYPAICGNCGWKGMSSLLGGGNQIADTGDYDDCSCPVCKASCTNEYGGVSLGENGYYAHLDLSPKLHTIRHDPNNTWKPGMKIHFVINNRTKNRFQFAPVIEVKSVQDIVVHTNEVRVLEIYDGHITGWRKIEDMERFAKNDGFPDAEYFMRYFHDFKHAPLSLIHWTDLKY